jgi:hypothetical protein
VAQQGEEHQRWDDQQQVGRPHQERVDPAPVVAGHRPDERAERGRHQRHDQRDLHRLLRAPQHLGEVVVADAVGAHRMLDRRWLGQRVGLLVEGVLPEPAAEQRQHHDQQQHHEAGDRGPVLEEAPEHHPRLGAGGHRELALGASTGGR